MSTNLQPLGQLVSFTASFCEQTWYCLCTNKKGEANYDHSKILAFAVSRMEYSQIVTHFTNFDQDQHPLTLQRESLTFRGASQLSSGYYEARFRLAGYSANVRNTVVMTGASDPILLTLGEELVYNTDNAATNEGRLTIINKPKNLKIGEGANTPEYQQIRDALYLVKRFHTKLYRQVEGLCANKFTFLEPQIKREYDGADYKDVLVEPKPKTVDLTLTIEFDSSIIDSQASTEIVGYTSDVLGTQSSIPIERYFPGVPTNPNIHAPDSGINKSL